MTLALFDSYLQGLRALRESLGTEHPQRKLADVYYQRLQENIDRTRYGNTANLDAARAEILDRCNDLCQKTLDLPFEEFCAQVKSTASLLTARLHTLPRPPADFIGREKELDALLTAIESGGALITGMGGVGKTTLALKLAEKLTPRYPDAQIYLDLRGVDPAPLTPAAVMTAILRAYHPTARLPEDLADLQPLYQAALANQRALLLLDNAADAAQLKPLLPPSACLLLVTSRQRFTLPGLRPLYLDALPEAESLLREIAPRVGDHAPTLAELCGCLPLALRWAGEALNDTTVAVPRYLERLQNERKLLEPAEASLRLSYDLLLPDLQSLWRKLSVFPADFDWLAAAVVWDVEREAAEDALDALTRRSLLICRDERYALHDLARLWSGAQVTADERAEAAYRHAEHYKDVLTAANQFYKQGNDGILAGLALYDREAANIHTGRQRMEDLMMSDLEISSQSPNLKSTHLTSDYPATNAHILTLRLHPREQIAWLEAALSAARTLEDRSTESAHLGNLGLAYAALGDTHRAIDCYEQALIIARETGNQRGESADLCNLGLAYAALGNIRRAIECYEQGLLIAREIGDWRNEGNNLGNLGIAYKELGDARRAIDCYEQQLVIVREIGDRRGEGNVLGNLGVAYKKLGDPRRAIDFYEQRLVIAREIGDRNGVGNALMNIGNAHDSLGDAKCAIQQQEQALEIFREIGDRRGEGNALANMGLAYKNLGEPERARLLWQETLAIFEAIEDPHTDWVRNKLAELDTP